MQSGGTDSAAFFVVAAKGAERMKSIQNIGIIGLGALGVLYAHLFTQALGPERVLVLGDAGRTARYRRDGVYLNGARCGFHYADAAAVTAPPDLLLFAVKFPSLEDAVENYRHLVGPDTTILSVLNGISSEEILGKAYGMEKIVWCVAQKMSAVKEGNRATISPFGELALGVPSGMDRSRLDMLTQLLDAIQFPYVLPADIRRHMWGKLMVNTGCNQTSMVFQCNYRGLKEPAARRVMVGAMQEVLITANAENIPLTEADLKNWIDIVDSFPDDGEPSMRQDAKACRRSEVELFSGTIRRLAKKHGIPVPVNDWLYARIQEMESAY
jgi:2-dehydropantoate 2-reductase